jgi:hypothetical protein
MKVVQKHPSDPLLVGYITAPGLARQIKWRWFPPPNEEENGWSWWKLYKCGLGCLCTELAQTAQGSVREQLVSIHLFNVTTGECVWSQTISRSDFIHWAVPVPSPDGKLVAVITRATPSRERNVTLHVFDIKSGRKVITKDIATEWWAMLTGDWKYLVVVHEGRHDVFDFELLVSGIAEIGY